MLMLALLRPRCLLRSPRLLQTRTLRTLPRAIPTYIKRWDPTLHQPIPHPRAPLDVAPPQTATDDANRRSLRQLVDASPTVVVQEPCDVRKAHRAFRKLRHLLQLAKSPVFQVVGMRIHVWEAYIKAKETGSRAEMDKFAHLSSDEWNTLWNLQAATDHGNRNRTVHLVELYRHIKHLGKYTTTGRQRAEYLESLFLNGKEEEAFREWEDGHQSTAPPEHSHATGEHLNVGAKLHALAGNAYRARAIMDNLFEIYPEYDTSVMMLVFRAHTSSTDKEHHDAAKEIYLQMKERKGARMTLDDYDSFLVGFLEASCLPHAKQVFRDMVKGGYFTNTDTSEDVWEVLKRLHMLYRLGTDISTMTSIALDAITLLPPEYHGHLFGDWMRLAVVTQAPEATAQILEMMFKRGCPPETIHFNLFLKALLRTKEDPSVLKAENIAWRMIEETRKAHKRARQPDTRAELISKRSKSPRPENLEPTRNLAPANVTTFALMMHHHAKKLQWEHVNYLSRQLEASAIAPNTTIMNVLIDNKCRQGAYTEAFAIYNQLTSPTDPAAAAGCFPNGATFRCLWKTLRLALGDHATRDLPGIPEPRDLLREMNAWWKLCRSRHDAERFKMGLAGADHGALTNLVMHCFSYTQDLAGSLVALHVLRQNFDIYPSDKAAQILQRQMAWIDTSRENRSSAAREQYFHSRNNNRNSERIARVYGVLLRRRLAEVEHVWADWDEKQVADLGLDLLSEFVRVVLGGRYSADMVETMIEGTCRDVGVEGMGTGGRGSFGQTDT